MALAQGASLQGRGFEPHSCRPPCFVWHQAIAFCQEESMTLAGLELAIPGSVGRCLIHWATGPAARDLRFPLRGARSICWRTLSPALLRLGRPPRPSEKSGIFGSQIKETWGVWRNGSASDSRSEGWELESLCPHCFIVTLRLLVWRQSGRSYRSRAACQYSGYSSVGRASDCRFTQRSDGPWLDSGWPDLTTTGRRPVPCCGRPNKKRPAVAHQPNLYLEQKWLRCLHPLT